NPKFNVAGSPNYLNPYTRPPAYFPQATAMLLNGSYQVGVQQDSTYVVPSAAIALLVPGLYTPTIPTLSYNVVWSAPDIYKHYRTTVTPSYTLGKGSALWCDSLMYNVKKVELCLFGPVAADGTVLGLFADPADADGATQIAYYGEASYQFDWTTGTLTYLGWAPRKDSNGNDAPTIISL